MTMSQVTAGDKALAADLNQIIQHLQGQSGSTDAYHFRSATGEDFIVTLADNAGVRELKVQDSDGNEVFSVDSDGNVESSGSFQPGTLQLPTATGPSQTTEGQVVWDSDDDVLAVGDGSTTKQFGYLGSTTPAANGTASAGTSKEVSRADHVHASDWTTIIKAADQTVNNSTTLVDDSELTFTAEADTDYLVVLDLLYNSGAAASHIQFQWEVPSGASAISHVAYLNMSGAVTISQTNPSGSGAINVGGSALNRFLRIVSRIDVGNTGGAVTLQWAQASAVSANTKVLKNSSLTYRRLGAT